MRTTWFQSVSTHPDADTLVLGINGQEDHYFLCTYDEEAGWIESVSGLPVVITHWCHLPALQPENLLQSVLAVAGDVFTVSPSQILESGRWWPLVGARYTAIDCYSELTRESTIKVGAAFWRVPTAVMHARRKLRDIYQTDPVMAKCVDYTRQRLGLPPFRSAIVNAKDKPQLATAHA
jgi:hypothetical protein